MRWEIQQLDIKTAFLKGVVEEEVYVEQRLGFETNDKKNHVWKLKKALYNINENPWDSTYNYMRSLKITYSDEYFKLCYKVEDENP